MSSDLEDANEKVNGLRLSLEGAYKEMAEMRRGLSEKEDQAQVTIFLFSVKLKISKF